MTEDPIASGQPGRRASLLPLLVLAAGAQLVVSYRSLAGAGSSLLLSNLFWIYAAVGLALGYAYGRFRSEQFNLAFWTGGTVLVAIAYVLEPSTPKLLLGSLTSLAAIRFGLDVFGTVEA